MLKTTTRITTHQLTLFGKEIAKLVCDANNLPADQAKYTVTFQVPRGGDYSGDILSLDEYPIEVFLHIKEES